MKSDQDLYRRLRALSWERLWYKEVPRYNAAQSAERLAQVAVIRAVGAALSEGQGAGQRKEVRIWLIELLGDSAEKIRRYAMAAIPKVGADPEMEARLLELLKTSVLPREKAGLARALEKIGGQATLSAPDVMAALPQPTAQKVQARVVREQATDTHLWDNVFNPPRHLRIHLRCRQGLETILRAEIEETIACGARFRIADVKRGLVAITTSGAFSLKDLLILRCFHTLSFVLGTTTTPTGNVEALAAVAGSPLTRRIMRAFAAGACRYRLEFASGGHHRSAIRQLAEGIHLKSPDLLNDSRQALWSIDIHPFRQGCSVELRPRLRPDPRFAYRLGDVPAASHPPLAACLARLAGRVEDDIVWDPFCGSGLELIERARLGGVRRLLGSDHDPQALAMARANLAAASLPPLEISLLQGDFREVGTRTSLNPGSVTLILTNPPMGRRVRVDNLHQLIADLFTVAEVVLQPGGRLVLANPLRQSPTSSRLILEQSIPADLGGFQARLERYVKTGSTPVDSAAGLGSG